MNLFSDVTFGQPGFLWLLWLLIPYLAWYIFYTNKSVSKIQLSSLAAFSNAPKTYKYWLRHLLFVLRAGALAALIIVLARPQSQKSWTSTSTEGIDIVLALDISSSMLAQDFNPNRLEAAKSVAIEFISGRENDRMGLVVFSGESFTQCPLTSDHAVLINLFGSLQSGMIEDGTAIGLGLANAVNRLRNSVSKSKVVILLTDGVNNRGEVAPQTAAEIAEQYGIRVYTIGVGTQGFAPYPVQTPFGVQYQNVEVEIDEAVLQEISNLTGGKYFRATDNNTLRTIYTEIDKLEKSKVDVKKHRDVVERYWVYALLAGLFLGLEILLRVSIFRSVS